MGGSNAQKHVMEEPKNAPGVLLNKPYSEVNHALKAVVKQGNATLNLVQVSKDCKEEN